MQKLNTAIAIFLTNKVGSMWCAYLFIILAFISFPAAIASNNVIVIISWIAQTFFQLVLLPVIMVGQNVQTDLINHRFEELLQTIISNQEKEISEVEEIEKIEIDTKKFYKK